MALIDEVKTRFGGATSRRLIELTNDSAVGGATINDTVLAAACTDAEGHFRRESGLEPDITLAFHIHLLIQGVIAYLEFYKGRESSVMNANFERFEKGLFQLRKRAGIAWQTNSPLSPSTDSTDALPDMDRKGKLQHMQLRENVRIVKKTLED